MSKEVVLDIETANSFADVGAYDASLLKVSLVGVYEFLSAPFPAPAGYRPIIEPEFPWDYFSGGTSSRSRR